MLLTPLDVDSLFNTLPPSRDETVNICVDELFENKKYIHGSNKKQITDIFPLTTKKYIILFDMTFFTQIDSVAMSSTLGSSLPHVHMYHHKTK